MSAVLSVEKLTKHYGAIQALKGVSFDVPKGSVFGILGPNGSGKTTLLGIVMNVLKPTSGSFSFNGKEADAETRRQVGTLLETPNFYHYLSAEVNQVFNKYIGKFNWVYQGDPKVVNQTLYTQPQTPPIPEAKKAF